MKSQVNIKAYTVQVLRDGNRIGVCIGNNLVEGVSGFGDDVPAALEDLARHLREAPGEFEPPQKSKLRDEISHVLSPKKRKATILKFPASS